MTSSQLGDAEWARVQDLVPIVCVDMLPVRAGSSRWDVGLILRSTPHQGERWCLIGGRVRLDEGLAKAAERHWSDAVGDSLPLTLATGAVVVEYAKTDRPGQPHDPRKNAIAITYPVPTAGAGAARGAEALDFGWFNPAELDDQAMGFGQELVVQRLLASLPSPPPA